MSATERWKAYTWVEKTLAIFLSLAGAVGTCATVWNVLHTDKEAEIEHQLIDIEATHVHDQLQGLIVATQQLIVDQQKRQLEREAASDIARHQREIMRLERDLTRGNMDAEERDYVLRTIQDLKSLQQCLREQRDNCT